MLSLRADHVADWVRASAPDLAATGVPVVRPVEDTRENQAALKNLGILLDQFAAGQIDILGVLREDRRGEHLAALMSQLGAARLLRVIEWLTEGYVEGGTDTANALVTGEFGDPACLNAMLSALHRQELLQRMFSESRLEQLLTAVKTATSGDAQ